MKQFGWMLVIGLALGLMVTALTTLFSQWRGDASLSHGPILLLIALILLWRERAAFLHWDSADPWGLAMLSLCAFLHIGAVWADIAFLIPFSFLGMVVCGVWFLGGRAAARSCAGPLGLLAWAIPWPTTLVTMISFPLQLISSSYAALFAGTFGLSIHREGVHISVMPEVGDKPIYSIIVAQQCSGLTSLMVLLAFGYLIAYFTPTRWWGRIALVSVVVPFALLGNAVRLTIILLVGGLSNAKAAQWVHDNEQPVLIFLCSFGLLGLRQLLLHWTTEPSKVGTVPTPATESLPNLSTEEVL